MMPEKLLLKKNSLKMSDTREYDLGNLAVFDVNPVELPG
jgi:hypothetical protein